MRKYLKESREKLNYTQAHTARLLNISQNYYCDIENGVRQKELKASLIIGLSDILKIPISDLLKYERERNSTKPEVREE